MISACGAIFLTGGAMSSRESASEIGLSGSSSGRLERLDPERRAAVERLLVISGQNQCDLTRQAAAMVERGDAVSDVLLALVSSLSAGRAYLRDQFIRGANLASQP